MPSSSHAAKNGSQWSPKMWGQPSFAGFSENVTAWQPFLATRSHLVGHELGVPDRRDRQRDEAPGVRAAPLVDVPVVVRAQQVETHVEVLRPREELTAELHEAREAHRAQHAVAVHVVDSFVDVPAALADPVERRRLDPVLLGWLARRPRSARRWGSRLPRTATRRCRCPCARAWARGPSTCRGGAHRRASAAPRRGRRR